MRLTWKVNRPNSDRHTALFVGLLVVYLLGTIWMIFRLPAGSGPNELLHYEYVASLQRTGALPDASSSGRADERHQPPLYYAFAALLSLPFPPAAHDTEFADNPHFAATHWGNLNPKVHATPSTVPVLYVARLASMLFGLISLVGLYLTLRRILPSHVGLLVVSLVAFHPMFLFLSATVNNDLAVTACSSLLTAWAAALAVQDGSPRRFFFWGMLLAAALLAKASGVFLLTLLPLACLVKWRLTRSVRKALLCAFWGLCGTVPLWGIWMLFNRLRGLDALGISRSVPFRVLVSLKPGDFRLIVPHLGTIWRSFWLDWSPGGRGYGADWLYLFWGICVCLGVVGWVLHPRRRDTKLWLLFMHVVWSIPLVGVFLATKTLMVKEAGFLVPEGRWILPIVPSMAWVVAVGWARLWSRHSRIACWTASLIPPLLAVVLLTSWLPRLYPQAQRLSWPDQALDHRQELDLRYGDEIMLRAVDTEPLYLGQESEVTVYWYALRDIYTDYTASLQLLVPQAGDWDGLDLQNSYPGSGLTPTNGWRQGEVYRDRFVLIPQGTLNGPTYGVLGMWLLADGEGLPVSRSGEAVDMPTIQQVVVRPSVPPSPADSALLTTPVGFGEQFDLIGIELMQEKENVELGLWWESRAPMATDYTVFVHLLDGNGQLRSQFDSMPDSGRSPTHIWQPGDVVFDRHALGSELPPGGTLLIGVYDLATMARLPACQGAQELADGAFRYGLP